MFIMIMRHNIEYVIYTIEDINGSLYHDFLDKGMLLKRKLLNQEFLVGNVKSSLRKFYGRRHGLAN